MTESFYKITLEGLNRKLNALGVTESNYIQRQKELHSVIINSEHVPELYHWCDDNFGDSWVWGKVEGTNKTKFYFLNSEDALVFRLKFASVDANQ